MSRTQLATSGVFPRARTASPAVRAFTLVELLMVLAIFSLMSGALFSSFLIGKGSYLSADAYVHVQEEARRAIDVMGRELRGARGAGIAGLPNSLQFPVALGYNLAAPCPANNVCWGAVDSAGVGQPNWTVQYRIVGTQLVREILNGGAVQPGTRVLANDVDAARTSFAYDALANTVTISLGVTMTSAQLAGGSMSTVPNSLTTRVKLRNDG